MFDGIFPKAFVGDVAGMIPVGDVLNFRAIAVRRADAVTEGGIIRIDKAKIDPRCVVEILH